MGIKQIGFAASSRARASREEFERGLPLLTDNKGCRKVGGWGRSRERERELSLRENPKRGQHEEKRGGLSLGLDGCLRLGLLSRLVVRHVVEV